MDAPMTSRYHEVYARARRDPEAFWAEAAQAIDWFEPPRKVFDPTAGIYGRWFVGGVFIGAGPWFHGPRGFHGHVDHHFDYRHGYHGPTPHPGDHPGGPRRDFHGSAHWDHRHEDMNANTFFNNRSNIQRALYRFMIAGYGIGGPVYIPKVWNQDRHRLFFFISQEFTQIAQPTVTLGVNQPTAAEIGGDFSNSRDAAGRVIPILDPLNAGKPFPGNVIPANRIDPTGQAYLKLLPAPNGYINPAPGQLFSANYLASETPSYNRRNTMLRFDGSITDKLTMFYRFGQDVDNDEFPFAVSPGAGTNVRFTPGYVHGVHLTYIASPTMVNEFAFGVGHDNWGWYHTTPDSQCFRTSSLNPPTLRPFPTGPLYENYLACARYSGGALPNPSYFYPGGQQTPGPTCSINPYKNFNDNYIFQDDLSKILGRHSLKTGIYVEYNSKVEPSAGATYYGFFDFGSTTNNPLDTGDGYSNALLGNFQSYTEATNRAVPNVHYTQIEGYLQDSFRLSKRLTLDYGMRFVSGAPVTDDSRTISDVYKQLYSQSQAARLYYPTTVSGKQVAIDRATGVLGPAPLVGQLVRVIRPNPKRAP